MVEKKTPMEKNRVLVYSMQSSGGSLFTFLLAQIPNSIGIIDLWGEKLAPLIDTNSTLIVKAIATTFQNYKENVKRIRPNLQVLFIRNPFNIYLSLDKKYYRDDGGITAEDQMRLLEKMFIKRHQYFDLTICYEHFTKSPSTVIKKLNEKGLAISEKSLEFKRTMDEILEYNSEHCPWCKEKFKVEWSFGNIHVDKLNKLEKISYEIKGNPSLDQKIYSLCPTLAKFYNTVQKKFNEC